MLDAAYWHSRASAPDDRREHITDALFPSRIPSPNDGHVWTVDTQADYERAVERSRRNPLPRIPLVPDIASHKHLGGSPAPGAAR